MPRLVSPSVEYVPSLRDAARRYGDDPQDLYRRDPLTMGDDDLVRRFRDMEVAPQAGWVPSSDHWWVEGVEFLGRVQIRHRLSPALRGHGGHVGYHVVPPHRGHGHGTAMLAAALPVCAGLGLECVLLTCREDNAASRRVIERNGGLFWDLADGLRRYWVPTFR